jgi:enoyl-CoA hydratase/carnithine racemase
VAASDRLDEATEALAGELLACAPRAVGLAKRVLDAAAKPALALTLEQEVAAQEALAASEDFAEGGPGVLREARSAICGSLTLAGFTPSGIAVSPK